MGKASKIDQAGCNETCICVAGLPEQLFGESVAWQKQGRRALGKPGCVDD
jgi:hypothetical protein